MQQQQQLYYEELLVFARCFCDELPFGSRGNKNAPFRFEIVAYCIDDDNKYIMSSLDDSKVVAVARVCQRRELWMNRIKLRGLGCHRSILESKFPRIGNGECSVEMGVKLAVDTARTGIGNDSRSGSQVDVYV